MSKVLRFNGIDYPMLNNPNIKQKSNDVSITNITIDFTGKTISDLPFKYQEVRVINNPGASETLELIGYVEKHILPTFSTGNETLLLTLKIMPPRVLSTKRTVTKVYESQNLKSLVNDLVSNLIADGFTIEFNDLSESTLLTKTYVELSIEKALNELAKEQDFVWYVDNLKKIYFRDSKTIFNQPVYSNWSDLDTNYIHTLQPQIRSNDYANVINLKNALIIGEEEALSANITASGQRFKFEKPIWLSPLAVQKTFGNNNDVAKLVTIEVNNTDYDISYVSGVITYPTGVGNYNDNPALDICLIFDENDSELLTEIQINLTPTNPFIGVNSFVTLFTKPYRFYDVNQIEQTATFTNTTGIIEKTISLNNKRLGQREMFFTAKGNILQANNEVGVVKVSLKNEITDKYLDYINGINLFTRFNINLPNLLTVGDFVVTSIERIENTKTLEVKLNLENKNFNETFLDIYRKEEIQEDVRQIEDRIVSILVKDEDFKETNNIFVNGVNVNAIT